MTFIKGDRVRYIPRHANGDRNHPDCSDGVVKEEEYGKGGSLGIAERVVWVFFDTVFGQPRAADDNSWPQPIDPTDLIRLYTDTERLDALEKYPREIIGCQNYQDDRRWFTYECRATRDRAGYEPRATFRGALDDLLNWMCEHTEA